MNIYDILAKEPKFAGTQRENLPAQVSLEWKFNESSKLVAIMVMAVDMILEKIDTMPIDSRESIQSSMRFIPLFFALEDHSAWLRLM